MAAPDKYGMGPLFATQENFEKYRIFALLERQAGKLQDRPRLVLTGYGGFRSHHQAAHEKMVSLGIAHEYRDGPSRRHAWGSGWLAEAVELLLLGGEKKP